MKTIILNTNELNDLTRWFKREQHIVKLFTQHGKALSENHRQYFLDRAKYCGDLARSITCKYTTVDAIDGLKGKKLEQYKAANELDSAAGSFYHSVVMNQVKCE